MPDLGLLSKYLSVILASTLKYLGGTFTGFALGLHWIETVIFSTVGMMVTILLTNFAGTLILQLIGRFRKKPQRKFTRLNRIAIKIWSKFGIAGIAFLTPALFTPPLGGALMVAFRAPRIPAFTWMLISGLVWGVIFTLLVYQMSFIREWFH